MSEKKIKVIENSADNFKKLPKEKQMFVLGYMQGVLSNEKIEPGMEKNKNARVTVSEPDIGR